MFPLPFFPTPLGTRPSRSVSDRNCVHGEGGRRRAERGRKTRGGCGCRIGRAIEYSGSWETIQ